jgi:hypothetical protein
MAAIATNITAFSQTDWFSKSGKNGTTPFFASAHPRLGAANILVANQQVQSRDCMAGVPALS